MLSEPHQRVPWDEGIRPGHEARPNFVKKIAKTPTRQMVYQLHCDGNVLLISCDSTNLINLFFTVLSFSLIIATLIFALTRTSYF